MIAKMKKLTFLIYHQEYETFLQELRELGVVHIVEKKSGEADGKLQEFIQKRNTYKNVLQAMQQLADNVSQKVDHKASGDELVSRYEELQAAIQSLQQRGVLVQKDIAQMKIWGNFDWKTIHLLDEIGWHMEFYTCTDRQFDSQWEEEYHAIQVLHEGGRVYFVTITKAPVEIDAEKVVLPELSLMELETEKTRLDAEKSAVQTALREFCNVSVALLSDASDRLQEEMDMQQVRLTGERLAEGSVLLLEGWVPEDSERTVVEMLDSRSIYYEMRKAQKEDNAPIKLTNNVFIRMYEVLTRMYGMPDYGEFDQTPMVAPFFTLFFAFCVGDAGYGLVLIALGAYLKKRMDRSMSGMMNLVMTLGGMTTILGMIFGTFFGVNLLEVDAPWLASMKQYMISSDKLMYLALAIGVIHIIVAMTVKTLCSTVRYGFKNSLSDWGWLLCVTGFVITGGLQYLEKITPEVANWAFIIVGGISAIGIFLLNDLKRNVFINIGAGVWATYNMATGLLGDVLSYIRLYALGLAGAMLGMVFNKLAFMIDIQIPVIGSILTWICCGAILVFGHTLNIAMSCLSGFVHPLRLTFVEYFKNSGYSGKGEAYKPFATLKEKDNNK